MDTCCKAVKHRSQHLHAASVDHAASVAAQAASLTNIHRMRWPGNKMYARVVLYLLVLHRTIYKRSNMRSMAHKQCHCRSFLYAVLFSRSTHDHTPPPRCVLKCCRQVVVSGSVCVRVCAMAQPTLPQIVATVANDPTTASQPRVVQTSVGLKVQTADQDLDKKTELVYQQKTIFVQPGLLFLVFHDTQTTNQKRRSKKDA